MLKVFLILITYLAFILSDFLTHELAWPPVLVISALGLLGTFYSHQGKIEKGDIHALIFIAGFAGTSNFGIIKIHLLILLIPLFIVFLYIRLKKMFIGFGGKLGFISFLSCLLFHFINLFLTKALP